MYRNIQSLFCAPGANAVLQVNSSKSHKLIEKEIWFVATRVSSWVKIGDPCSSDGKEFPCNAGDPGSIPGSGRSSRERNGNPLQYSCLENPMDRRPRWATVHGVAKSQTQLSNWHFHLYFMCFQRGIIIGYLYGYHEDYTGTLECLT